MKHHDANISRFKDCRGMISFVIFLLAVVGVSIGASLLLLTLAVLGSGDGLNAARSQLVEKNSLSAIVKESILSIRETSPINSAATISQEINTRLGAMSFSSGVTVTLSSADVVPVHPFYPNGTAPVAGTVPMFAASQPYLAGTGNTAITLLSSGPAGYLGSCSYTFGRTVAGAPNESRVYQVTAQLFSVPLTNVGLTAYALPASGAVPPSAPTVPASLFNNGASRITVTSNNPANDPTAFPDCFVPSNPEIVPAQYRDAISFAANAYEYVWGDAYQGALLNTAGLSGIWDFAIPPANNPAITGVSYSAGTVFIDVGSVTAPIVAVVDSLGGGSVQINGSSGTGAPFILYIKNTSGIATSVTFSGNNSRPFLLLARNCMLGFIGTPQIQAGIILDRYSSATGNCMLFGHLSYYALNNPFPGFNLQLFPNAAVQSALAPIAPRVLVVSTRSTR